MISVTPTARNGETPLYSPIAISQKEIVPGSLRPLTSGNTATAACFKLWEPDGNGVLSQVAYVVTDTYATVLAALTTDAAESGSEVTTNKSTDFAAANRNDTKYPSTEAVYENFQPIWYGTTTGADLLYVSTLSPAPTAYAAGMKVSIMFGTTNTGASAINLNGLGAKAIRKGTGGATALSASDLVVTKIYTLIYDGTNFQINL